jgi:hypothetical protein
MFCRRDLRGSDDELMLVDPGGFGTSPIPLSRHWILKRSRRGVEATPRRAGCGPEETGTNSVEASTERHYDICVGWRARMLDKGVAVAARTLRPEVAPPEVSCVLRRKIVTNLKPEVDALRDFSGLKFESWSFWPRSVHWVLNLIERAPHYQCPQRLALVGPPVGLTAGPRMGRCGGKTS